MPKYGPVGKPKMPKKKNKYGKVGKPAEGGSGSQFRSYPTKQKPKKK